MGQEHLSRTSDRYAGLSEPQAAFLQKDDNYPEERRFQLEGALRVMKDSPEEVLRDQAAERLAVIAEEFLISGQDLDGFSEICDWIQGNPIYSGEEPGYQAQNPGYQAAA